MKIKIAISLLSVFLAGFLGCAAQANDFSADMVTKSGRHSSSGKVFVSGSKMRMVMQEAVSISRPDKKIVWVLLPEQKMYMEQAIDPRSVVATGDKPEGEIERVLVGQETVDGKACQKYKVVYTYQGKKEAVFQWIAPGFSMPIKTAGVDGSWFTEFRNIQAGPQASSLFEIPAGYTKFSQNMPTAKDVLGGVMKDIF